MNHVQLQRPVGIRQDAAAAGAAPAQPDQAPPDQGRLQAIFGVCESVAAALPPVIRNQQSVTVMASVCATFGGMSYHFGDYSHAGVLLGAAVMLVGGHMFSVLFYPPHVFR